MKKILLLLLSALFLTISTGCGSSSEEVKPTVVTNTNALPSWYTQTQDNDKSYIHGLGTAATRKESLNNALNDAVSTLNVSVSSTYRQETSSASRNGLENYDKKSQENIEVVTDKLTLNNYEVVEQQQLGNGSHIVMVRINKHQLFSSLLSELENSYRLLDVNLQNKSNELEMILIYRKSISKIRQKMKTLGIMHTLNPAFDDEEYKNRYSAVISAHNELVENKRFKLKINDPYHIYTKHIRKGLMQDGVKLTTNDKYDYIVRVNIQEQEKIAVRRQVITFLTTAFSVGIGDNTSRNDIFYTNFKLNSQSDDSLEQARGLVTQALEKKIERYGLFNVVGDQ